MHHHSALQLFDPFLNTTLLLMSCYVHCTYHTDEVPVFCVCFACLYHCLLSSGDVCGSGQIPPALCLVFSPSSLRLAGWPLCLCGAQGLLHLNGMVKRADGNFECIVDVWQLCFTLSLEQGGCAQGSFIFFFITLLAEPPLPVFPI